MSDDTRLYRRHDINVEAYQLPVEPTEDDNQAFHAWADRVGLKWASERHGTIAIEDPQFDEPDAVIGAEGGNWILKEPGPGITRARFHVLTAERFEAAYEPVQGDPPHCATCECADLREHIARMKEASAERRAGLEKQLKNTVDPSKRFGK